MKKKKPAYEGKPRLRRGDEVVVIAGADRGATGKVLKVLPERGRVVVEGVNMIKRATRPNPQKNIKGGIVDKEASMAIANVMLRDPESGKPTRVGIRGEGSERVRFAKRSGTTVSSVAKGSKE
jgi:large subunit ribosomal protein L24